MTMMPMQLLLVSVLSLLSTSASAFGVLPGRRHQNKLAFALHQSKDSNNDQVVDMNRAKDCADHFGKCSIEEMEELKSGLHRERLQQFMFGSHSTSDKVAWEESLDHRLMEEELELQLNMLKEKDKSEAKPSLFPEVEAPMEELPHLKDHTIAKKTEDLVNQAEVTLAMEETVLEESTLETAAICGLIAMLAFVPGLIENM